MLQFIKVIRQTINKISIYRRSEILFWCVVVGKPQAYSTTYSRIVCVWFLLLILGRVQDREKWLSIQFILTHIFELPVKSGLTL